MRHSEITGHVEHDRRSDVWRVRLNHGTDPTTGKRRQVYDPQTHPTERAARKHLAGLLHEANAGPRLDPTQKTVKALVKEWLETEATLGVRPKTLIDYESICRNHILPFLGDRSARSLSSASIAQYRATLLAEDRSVAVASRAVFHLSQALEYGVRHRFLAVNHARTLKPLRRTHREMQVWTAAEARTFLVAAAPHIYSPLWALLLHTAVRQGEALGLQWGDVDLEHGLLSIRRSIDRAGGTLNIEDTKTHQSRTIDLDRAMVRLLRRHRAAQGEKRLQLGELWGGDWVFATATGVPLDASHVRRAMMTIRDRLPVRKIRFHDLRHTAATLMLAAGVPIKVVSERLGHASVLTTLQTYAHVLPNMQHEAAKALGLLLTSEPERKPTARPTARRVAR